MLVTKEMPLYHPELVNRLPANLELNRGSDSSQLEKLRRNVCEKTRIKTVSGVAHLRCELVSNKPPSVQVRSLRLSLSLVSLLCSGRLGNLKQSRACVHIPYFEPSEVDPVDIRLRWTQVILGDGGVG